MPWIILRILWKIRCKMPFLNGGLFEPINGYNWYETDILIKNTIKKILDIFNQYNFTVTEDQPLIEKLQLIQKCGKVFENYLMRRKKKGGALYSKRGCSVYV